MLRVKGVHDGFAHRRPGAIAPGRNAALAGAALAAGAPAALGQAGDGGQGAGGGRYRDRAARAGLRADAGGGAGADAQPGGALGEAASAAPPQGRPDDPRARRGIAGTPLCLSARGRGAASGGLLFSRRRLDPGRPRHPRRLLRQAGAGRQLPGGGDRLSPGPGAQVPGRGRGLPRRLSLAGRTRHDLGRRRETHRGGGRQRRRQHRRRGGAADALGRRGDALGPRC